MGQAKNRGSYEERRAQAQPRGERLREELEAAWNLLSDEEKRVEIQRRKEIELIRKTGMSYGVTKLNRRAAC